MAGLSISDAQAESTGSSGNTVINALAALNVNDETEAGEATLEAEENAPCNPFETAILDRNVFGSVVDNIQRTVQLQEPQEDNPPPYQQVAPQNVSRQEPNRLLNLENELPELNWRLQPFVVHIGQSNSSRVVEVPEDEDYTFQCPVSWLQKL